MISLLLEPTNKQPLTPALPGQFVVLRTLRDTRSGRNPRRASGGPAAVRKPGVSRHRATAALLCEQRLEESTDAQRRDAQGAF